LEEGAISSVQNMIMCTGVIVNYEDMPFGSAEERISGYALGTADLLGQMSAPDYLEKLPMLYQEFEEAYHYEGVDNLRARGVRLFESPAELIRNTPDFYEREVKTRLEKMGAVHRYLTNHFTDHKNHYIEAIEKNMTKIRVASLF
jgi:hypothetical protein